jgi:ribosomal protein S18 acetylase RimI-like enzyme
MAAIAYRPAQVADAAVIHALLLAIADDLPLAVETLEQEEALYAALRKLLGFGESWVAEDSGRIVGFVLVENIQTGRHWGENEALDLRYAGIDPAYRDGDVFDALMAKVLDRMAPITASVKDANRIGLAARLEKLGFRQTETRTGETHFRRDPGAQS